MNRKIFFLFLGIFFLESIAGVQEIIDSADIGGNIGLEEGIIVGEHVQVQEMRNEGGQKYLHITFDESGNLEIKKEKFTNIDPNPPNTPPSYIEVDNEGEIIKADFHTNGEGGSYKLGGALIKVPPNTRVVYNKKTNTLILYKGTKIINAPKMINIRSKSEKIELPDGTIFSGSLIFDEWGNAFIPENSEATINSIRVVNDFGNKMNVFFDGRDCARCISFGEEKLIVKDLGEKGYIEFLEGNPYLKIEEGDYVAMNADTGSSLQIENRDSRGLIPKVTCKGNCIIDEDSSKISIEQDPIIEHGVTFFKKMQHGTILTTSPIEIYAEKIKWNQKLIVDNFNRFAFIDQSIIDANIPSESTNAILSAKLKYNYPSIEDLEDFTGKKVEVYVAHKGEESLLLGKLRDYWASLSEEGKKNIKKIYFAEEFGVSVLGPIALVKKGSPDALYSSLTKGVYFRSDVFCASTFRHEATHAIIAKTKISAIRFSPILNEFEEIMGEINYGSYTIKGAWKLAEGEDISKKTYKEKYGEKGIFPSAYASTNMEEFVCELAAQGDEYWVRKVSKNSKEYSEKLKKTFELLCKTSIINIERCNKIKNNLK